MKKFALIGAAGYIAPKHMQAIKDVGGELVAALDPHDSVGVLDKYAPNCSFFTEEHRFRRFLDKNHVDYVSICSPNYLHYDHILLAIGAGANAICEKPLVVNPENLEQLKNYSRANKIHPILQLRQHPVVQDLAQIVWRAWLKPGSKHKVAAAYKTYRGPWYSRSWKGDKTKSGGLAVNIGVHLFDLLIYLFGEIEMFSLLRKTPTEIIGNIYLAHAEVYFHLDINSQKTERSLKINDNLYELSMPQNLHTKCYQDILDGKGLSISDAESSLILASHITKQENTL